MMTDAERLERWRQSKAEGLALFAQIDARRAEPRRRPADDDGIHRRDMTTHREKRTDDDDVDALADWRRDGEAREAARRRENRARARIEAKAMHEAREHSDAVTTLQVDVAQVSNNLATITSAVTAVAEEAAKAFHDQANALAVLAERLTVAETKAELAETRAKEARTELNQVLVAQSILKSELADTRLELKQAIYDRRVAETAPMLGTA
jgi:hypothetical protein